MDKYQKFQVLYNLEVQVYILVKFLADRIVPLQRAKINLECLTLYFHPVQTFLPVQVLRDVHLKLDVHQQAQQLF